MKRLILLGGGGHCKVVLQEVLSLKEFAVDGIVDRAENLGKSVLGIPIRFEDHQLSDILHQDIGYAFVTVGSVGRPEPRRKLQELAKNLGYKIPAIISSHAIVSAGAQIGEGVFVGPGAVVNAGAVIEEGAIINSGAVVEHDCRVGSFVHVSPGAVLCGEVRVGDFTHIGAGSVVVQGLNIGASCMIGAGSVITKNIAAGKLAYGNPCREMGAYE